MCGTYNPISGQVLMLVTHHLIQIQYMMEVIHNIAFNILRILDLLWKSYFIPVRYELDMLLASTNRTNFIFVHNKLGLCASLFLLINSLCIYSGNLPLAV